MAETVFDTWEAIEKRSQRLLPKDDKYVPWGTGLVEGAKDLATRATGQLQEWAKEDPDTWTDDLLRLTGGGIKNVGNTMADWERRSEEGERGLRAAAGTALRFMNWSSEQGARLGRTGARAIGVNEELGGFLGSFIPEAIGTKGLSKAAQIGKTTKQLRKLRSLGAMDFTLDAATTGKFAFASGEQATDLLSDVGRATKGSFRKGTDKKLTAIKNTLLSEGSPNYLKHVDTDVTGYNWIKQGGELDQHLDDLLKVKAKTTIDGKVFKKGDVLTYDQLSKAKKDTYDSLLATGPALDADDVLFYGYKDNPLSDTAGMNLAKGWSPQLDKSMEFHHKGMKVIQRDIHSRARQLRNAGKASDADLLNLHGLSNSYGTPSGSRKSAAVFMNRMPHEVLHKHIMLKNGVQPQAGKWLDTVLKSKPSETPSNIWKAMKRIDNNIKRYDLEYIDAWVNLNGKQGPIDLNRALTEWKKFKKSKQYTLLGPDNMSEIDRMSKKIKDMDINELMSYQKEILEEITVPMTETAEKLEDYFSTFSHSEKLGIRTGKRGAEFNKGFEAWQRRLEDIDEVRRDRNVQI